MGYGGGRKEWGAPIPPLLVWLALNAVLIFPLARVPFVDRQAPWMVTLLDLPFVYFSMRQVMLYAEEPVTAVLSAMVLALILILAAPSAIFPVPTIVAS